MITNRFFGYCFVLFMAVPVAMIASPASTAPGAYHDWKGEIDEVVVVQPFRADNYRDIFVESFDTAGVHLPDPRDNTYEAVRSALQSIRPAFSDGFQKKLRNRVEIAGANRAKRGTVLVIRARLTKVDPGSQAARYWGGFGAGAVKIAMAGEIVDLASAKTLATFKQERRSAFGAFGGGYGALFARTARQIGGDGDVATLINAF